MTAQVETQMTVADSLCRALEELGVRVAFGIPGVHNLALWDAIRRSDIRLVGVRHEQTAAYAADGYARLTGELGVALTTTGPGAANAIAATGEAWTVGSPILVISTDIPESMRQPGRYRAVLHESRDECAMFAPVVKESVRVAAGEDPAATLLAAGELALRAPTGPVYLEVPTDRLDAPAAAPGLPSAIRSAVAVPHPSTSELDAAAALLRDAEKPLIWLGRGGIGTEAATAIGDLAKRLSAPVIETYGARGAIPVDHPAWIGLPPHLPAVGDLWDEADVVLGVGANFSATSTQNWAMPRPPKLITVNVDPEVTMYEPDPALVGDAAAVIPELLTRLEDLDGDWRGPDLGQLRSTVLAGLHEDDPDGMAFIADLADCVPSDTPMAVDMCVAGYWTGALRAFSAARLLAYPIGWGTLGFGFPASIGTVMAADRPTVCVCGDGGFLFACGELSTVAEQQPPLTIVLVDDGGYGMLRFDQEVAGRETFGVDFPTANFVDLARSFGITASRVTGTGPEFRDALNEAISAQAPRLIVLEETLRPPPSSGPRWYRTAAGTDGDA